MEQGQSEVTILTQCVRNNLPYPAAIANAPIVEIESSLYYTAFDELQTERRYDLGPIPWGSINDYMTVYEFDTDQREIGFDVIRRTDKWLVNELRKRRAAKNPVGTKSKPKKKGALGGGKGF